jgi:N-acetylmuramoyl-L-alanine amidase
VKERLSPHHDARPAGTPIDTLVLHYTDTRTAQQALDILCGATDRRVSAHYLVEEDATVWRLVPEERRAWHAGVSHWRGRENLNTWSIGIEVANPGHLHGYRAFPDRQIRAVIALCRAILGRHHIAAADVVAHSDIAPDRKRDPGELFPWARLAEAGIGLWPGDPPRLAEGGDHMAATLADLARIGFRPDPPAAQLVTAFQRHWAQHRVDGVADARTRWAAARVAALAHGTIGP